ncbi:MAG TPA: nitroreductase family protein [Gammaproteobacteria bacterium]|nr:nitroreductase family protein [Gammaproteobacteria bacterium]
MKTPTLSVSEALATRRAIKHFLADHRMPEETFRLLMRQALYSPTAFNLQHWRFIRITDGGLRQSIREAAWDQAQVTEASELLVLCFDRKAWEKNPQRYWQQAPAEVRDFVLPAIHDYYNGREQVQRDEGMRSCGMVAMSLMLMARELGYDTCPMDGFDYATVAQLIKLPADHEICMMLAIGKKAQDPWPRPGQLDLDEVLLDNAFT